ncbi:hypothetical protein [Nonomuraea sp. SYSU D8015]|uniref:hypothetical protein n=1 Tax=Nonomuraea sp. SYSU D8015 TaxID=2593644 RepID=UPI001660921A|nr:hypothetical protein [Nonomuraea sp. SYSU D8015]
MSAQIPDTVAVDGTEHDVVAIDGGPLFDPAGHGIRPAPLHTGCYRGFVCAYTIRDRLFLHALTLGSGATAEGAPISARATLLGGELAAGEDGEWTAAT